MKTTHCNQVLPSWALTAFAAGLMACLVDQGAVAETVPEKQPSSLFDEATEISLEDLINIRVTSVSKKLARLQDSPAAIAVITQEDIRRSGITSIPELMRMVPGVNVGRINARTWAISVRGFNDQYANKLLVLQDGRSVYTPAFSGTLWDSVDYALEDIDRIEIIRGPGATVWGANAVNGVINIVTKSAKDTQGGMFSTAYGTEEQPLTTMRYGGTLAPNLYYRVYGKYFNRDNFETPFGSDSADDSRAIRGGLRLDWEPSDESLFTLQGDYYQGVFGENLGATQLTPPFQQMTPVDNRNNGHHVLGRWTRTISDTSKLSLQTYYDHYCYENLGTQEKRSTYDVDLQHEFTLGERQALVWGVGYRYSQNEIPPTFYLSFNPSRHYEQIYSAFLQDEITVVEDRLKLTLGSKFEHNNFTGFEVQPSGRLVWTPAENQTVWGSFSRAVRTPSEFERDGRINSAVFPGPAGLPGFVSAFGGGDMGAEELLAYEVGYRIEPRPRLSLDLSAFLNVYDDIINITSGPVFLEPTPLPPHVILPYRWSNQLSGKSHGAEVLAHWHVTDDWKLTAGYTLLQMRFNGDAREGDVPQQQFQLRSYWNLPRNLELNGAAYYTDRLTMDKIPAFVRCDLGLTWRPSKSWEVAVWGQNIFDSGHVEFGSTTALVMTEIPRSVYAKITFRF